MDFAARGDRHHFVAGVDSQDVDDFAVALGRLDVEEAAAPAPLRSVTTVRGAVGAFVAVFRFRVFDVFGGFRRFEFGVVDGVARVGSGGGHFERVAQRFQLFGARRRGVRAERRALPVSVFANR